MFVRCALRIKLVSYGSKIKKGDWVVFLGMRATLISIYDLFLIVRMCLIIACRSCLLTFDHVGAYVYICFKWKEVTT